MPGSGRNQTSRPALSTIIGPFCFWSFFCFALRKIRPGAVGWRPGDTVTSGGAGAGRGGEGGGAPPLVFFRVRFGVVTRPGKRAVREGEGPPGAFGAFG